MLEGWRVRYGGNDEQEGLMVLIEEMRKGTDKAGDGAGCTVAREVRKLVNLVRSNKKFGQKHLSLQYLHF